MTLNDAETRKAKRVADACRRYYNERPEPYARATCKHCGRVRVGPPYGGEFWLLMPFLVLIALCVLDRWCSG